MENYIINENPQANGDYEIHSKSKGCSHMPHIQNQIDLGYHASCREAVAEAKKRWPHKRINGCFYCCPLCHTS